MVRKYYGQWNCVFSHVRITTTNNHCILMKGIYALSFLSPLLLCCREVEKSKLLDWRFFPYLIIRFQQFYQLQFKNCLYHFLLGFPGCENFLIPTTLYISFPLDYCYLGLDFNPCFNSRDYFQQNCRGGKKFTSEY